MPQFYLSFVTELNVIKDDGDHELVDVLDEPTWLDLDERDVLPPVDMTTFLGRRFLEVA